MSWPTGRRAALSLTYDDALVCHHTVARQLHERGMHATFYLPAAGGGVASHVAAWREVAAQGHELGNHTCFHPCRRNRPDMTWLDPAYDLCIYSARRFKDEVRTANTILQLIDGRERRSYGNTCHNETIGPDGAEESIRPMLAELAVAARGPRNDAIILPGSAERFGLGCWTGDRRRAGEVAEIAQRALAAGGWAILCFHGVGKGTHNGYIEADEHARMIDALATLPELWVAPVAEVAAAVLPA